MVGTVSQVGTRVFVGGTASGIDTAALIDAAVQQKTFRADRLDIEIDENSSKIAAYNQLQSLANNFVSSLNALKGSPGIFDENETVFDLKSGVVTTSDGKDFSNFVDIAIDKSALNESYDIEIIQEAKPQRVISTATVTDGNADLGYVGTFELGLSGNPPGYLVNITANMSLNEIAAAINTAAQPREVNAAVLQVNENDFKLVLTGVETNQSILTSVNSGDDILSLLGVTDGGGNFNNELQAPEPALVELNNVLISRNTNSISDLIEGVELNIKDSAPGTIINLEVGNDSSSVKDAILSLIESYNAFRDFVTQNQQVSANGVVAENAKLFGDNLLSGLANEFSASLGAAIGSGSIQTIRDLGITIGEQNKLEISNEVALDNAILNNFEEIRAAFGSSGTSSNVEFALLANTSNLPSQNITFDITTDGAGTITNVSVGGNNSLFRIEGNSIIGIAGSAYQGLRFAYSGENSATVNFQFNQGLADRLINGANGYINPVDGLISQEKVILQGENKGKAEDAQEIRDRAESFRERQIAKYADFEAKLQQLETLKSQIRAILGTDKDDD